MKKNQVGKSGLYVSALTLGCMSLGTDKKKAARMIDEALDAGVNHLDTADLYDFGENEKIVGEAIKGKRDQLLLTSKVGNHFDKDKKDWFWDPSKDHIKNGLKESLRRLKTDYLDFYLLHGGTIDDPISESIEAFEELKTEGYIRAYGISSIRPNVIREYVANSQVDAVMMQYSMLDNRPEEEILDLLHANSISVFARGPLAKGLLSNHSAEKLKGKGKDGYLEYSGEELQNLLPRIEEQTRESADLNALAFRYVLQHPAVASAVFGASSLEQLRENSRANVSESLPNDVYLELQQLTKRLTYNQHR
ncbi:aldo/keto reductase [Lentibacillus sediminis]|uniref:aldo/keto reductase n=1 Tax=Lentibacillus sediminis TaxID=1940529 RepID=UPI000C1BED1E|nr:aldo/keto reductase [Lentibacillus sediminis]